MANPGTRLFTRCNMATETVYGTPVAPTRQLYMGGDGMWDEDIALNFHETENRGLRTRVARTPTQQSEDTTVTIADLSGTSYDELAIFFLGAFAGGATFVGAGADRTVTATPSMTASNSPKSYTLDVGDDIQNWRLQGVMFQTLKLSASRGDVTQLELGGFAQRSVKTAAASPATNAPQKIPGDLWTAKFATTQAGLAGASIVPNFLLDWDLELNTGLMPRHYMDGNLYIGQAVESQDISGVLNLTVESTAQAISQFYDKYKAQTLDFIRLKATGPVLGASNYAATLDIPVYYDNPETIGSEEDGVNLYKVPARMAYDPTSAKSIQPVFVTSLTAMP